MPTTHTIPLFARLVPRTEWTGGRLTDTDIVTLQEAARFASKHAGAEITPADFLRAGARGEILVRAICPRAATMEPCRETDKPLVMPENCIPTLPLDACKALSITGRAKWRTLDGFEKLEASGGVMGRFARWQLPDTEPDLVTTLDDCRVTGLDIHSMADAFIDKPAPAQNTATPAPLMAGSASEPELNSQWWEDGHNMREMWQNIGLTLHSQKKRTSNTEIAKEIEKRINNIERSKGRDRVSPNWDTIRGKFSGWVWKTD